MESAVPHPINAACCHLIVVRTKDISLNMVNVVPFQTKLAIVGKRTDCIIK